MPLTWSGPRRPRHGSSAYLLARGMVAKGVERYATENGISVITPDVMQTVRERAEARYGRRFGFRSFFRGQSS